MQSFRATAPQEFVAILIFALLFATKQDNRFLLVITHKCSKLAKTISLTNNSASKIAKAFVDNSVLVYGPPKWLLFDNETLLTTKIFQHVSGFLVGPTCSRRLTIRSVWGRRSNLIEPSKERYDITSPITGGNRTYSRTLSRMRTIRKKLMRQNVQAYAF